VISRFNTLNAEAEAAAIIASACAAYGREGSLRYGQCLFNAASARQPDFTSGIQGHPRLDCFHNDDNTDAFMAAFVKWRCRKDKAMLVRPWGHQHA